MKWNSSIKRVIKNCLPYGVVNCLQRTKTITPIDPNSFMGQYFNYIDNAAARVTFDEDSRFKNIIDIQGFGWSGSSAALDLLSEYDDTEVMGLIDRGSQAERRVFNYEIELFRTAGGIFEIEKFIGKISLNSNDALIHRLVLAITSSEIYLQFEEMRPYFYEFFSQIVTLFSRNNNASAFNNHLPYNGNNVKCYLTKMSVDDYHRIARRFANTLLNRLFADSNKGYLVADQICGDDQRDLTFYRNYFPNIKSIFVYRDPRDVFYDANHFKVAWIPYEDVNSFILWYKYCMQTFSLDGNGEYLVVRFEDLVYDYQKQVERIEEYVGLTSSQHLYPKKCLDVSVSRKNVGLWRSDRKNSDAYIQIKKELGLICYDL